VGTKGAGLGLSAKGKLYTHLGRWGLYHRQDLGSINPQPATSSKGIGFWILIAPGILLALFIALSVGSGADQLDVFAQEGRRALGRAGSLHPAGSRRQTNAECEIGSPALRRVLIYHSTSDVSGISIIASCRGRRSTSMPRS
jgi:hypothetical protein